jgi:hypothetical protein
MLMHGGRAEFVADFDRFVAGRFEPGFTARLAARARGHALDRALIDGADPSATAQLAARAATLTSMSMRREVARGLDRLARDGREAQARWQLRPFKRAAAANAAELHALATRLRGSGPLYARGIAMLSRLLTEGAGPAYSDRRGELLAQRLHDASVALGA